MKIALGLLLCLLIGVGCRLAGIPLPAPPVLVGALLVVAMTLGYVVVDRWIATHPAKHKGDCGGPSGASASASPATPLPATTEA